MSINALYTPKQKQVLRDALVTPKWRMMINHGAKRSGKTVVDNDLFLMELRRVRRMADAEGVEMPMYILAGYSSKSIQNNILQELTNKYGIDFKFDKHNSFVLFGVKVVQTFTGSIAGLGAIRGMTAWGAYVNEASLATKDVFQEIIDRCSAPGSHIICDTNPDSPNHYLKVDYIDNHDPEAGVLTHHFTIDDNTFLPDDYVTAQKAGTPSGMTYDRTIRGLWVNGEGVVYQDFDEREMVQDHVALPPDATIYCGVDWGYEHKGSIGVFADDGFGNTILVEEHTAKHQEIDYWVRIAHEIEAKYRRKLVFWCDGARPEHVARFIEEGLDARYADKSVISGIEEVAGLMKTGHFYVSRDGIPPKTNSGLVGGYFFDEVYLYVWDEKTGMPVKQNDDVMDMMRYAIYSQHHAPATITTFKVD